MIKFITIISITILLFCSFANAQRQDFLGEWKSSNSDAFITRVRISESEGSVRVRVWGMCGQNQRCDWGTQNVTEYFPTAISSSTNGMSAIFDRSDGFGNSFFIFSVTPSKFLKVQQMTTYSSQRSFPINWTSIVTMTKTPDTVISAPALISPAADARLTNSDLSLNLKWSPLNGATSYLYDLEYFDRKTNKWIRVISNGSVEEPQVNTKFVGRFWGRWRVKAVSSAGLPVEISEWRRFNFETSNAQTPANGGTNK